ncbi:MAG: response regulator transcription factor [Bacteroidota bacterium]
MINLLIADDHPIVSDGLERIFENKEDVHISGIVRNGREMIEHLEDSTKEADVVLVDIKMPVMNGLEASKYAIQSKKIDARLILYSMYVDEAKVAEAIDMGVDGYISKGCLGKEIYNAVKKVKAGEVYYCKDVKEILDNARILLKNRPSKREQEVIEQVEKGLQDTEIADELNIAPHTVRDHVKNLRRKFGVNNRTELLHVLRQKGFI